MLKQPEGLINYKDIKNASALNVAAVGESFGCMNLTISLKGNQRGRENIQKEVGIFSCTME